MNRQKLIPIMSLICLCLVIGSTVAFNASNQEMSPRAQRKVDEEATPIQLGVMTEKQRQHSKLYKEYNVGLPTIPEQLDSGQPGVLIKKGPPLVGVPGDPVSISFHDFLRDLACGADAVVIGRVKNKSSQLTEAKDFVFTDYEVTVDEVLKDNTANHIAPKTDITITRPGGKIQLDGKTVQAIDASFPALKIGKRYLFFLNFVPTTAAYKAVSRKGSFELGGVKVSKLIEEPLFVDKEIDDTISFMTEARTAVAEGCRDK
jgi:hypothetical protein